MKYLGLRLDIPLALASPLEYEEYIDGILSRYNNILRTFGEIKQITYGLEIAIKTKKLHFHYHVGIDPQLDSKNWLKGMSSYITRNWGVPSTTTSDIKCALPPNGYSISPPKKPTDEGFDITRWFGYPFKDYSDHSLLSFERIKGFTEEEIQFMYLRATAERKVSLATYQKHENKLNNDKISRDNMWKWLDEQLPNLAPAKNLVTNAGEVTHYNPVEIVAEKIVEYHCVYNNYNIPMDLKRRSLSYVAKRGVMTYNALANWIMR